MNLPELLALCIGTPSAYLWIAWRFAIPRYRKHRASAKRWPMGDCLCSTKGEAAFAALAISLAWPFLLIGLALMHGTESVSDALDHAADKPKRVRSYMRYVPILCERHRADRDARIAQLERELADEHSKRAIMTTCQPGSRVEDGQNGDK